MHMTRQWRCRAICNIRGGWRVWGWMGVGGGGLGLDPRPPTPGVQPPTPAQFFLPTLTPFVYFLFFVYPDPPKIPPALRPSDPHPTPSFLQKPPYPRPLTPDVSRAFCLKMTLFWLLASLFDSNQNWMHGVFSATCTMVSRMKFIVKNKANLILTHWGRNKNVRHIANGIFNFISLIENQCIF